MTMNSKPVVNLKSAFSDKSFLKNLFIIAVPIILQNFISSFVNILDTIMIGRLGTIELAAVGLGNQLFFLLNLILYGIGSGGMVFTAQFWGKKDFNGLQKTFALSLIVAVFFSTLFTLACTIFPKEILSLYSKDAAVIEKGVDYLSVSAFCFLPFAVNFIFMITLRSIEKVRVAVGATLVSLFVNLILNAILIFGLLGFPALGVKGAAIATVASRAAELIILFSVTKKKKYPILGKLKNHFDFDLKFIRQYFAIVMPVLINESLWSLGITFHHKIFAGIGTFAYAAYNITNTVSMLTWVIFIGFGNGVSVLIGKKIGEQNYDEAKTYAAKVSIFVPFVAVFVGAMLIPISYLTPIFFNVETVVLQTVMKLFIILACCYPLKAFNMCMLVGIIRAGGDTRFGIICDTAVMWCVSIPLAYSLSVYTSIPAWGIYICLFSEEPFKALLGLWRIRSGKWLRSVTD